MTFLNDIPLSAPWWAMALIGLVALIKTWPSLKKLSMDDQAKLREERREDYKRLADAHEALQAKVNELEARTTTAERHCTTVDVRMSQLEFVIRMLMDRLEEVSPGDDVVRRAKTLLPAAIPVHPMSDETLKNLTRVTRTKE